LGCGSASTGRPDLTHFTNEGYNLLGRYIAGGIMKLYDSGPEAVQSAALEGNPIPAKSCHRFFLKLTALGRFRPERIMDTSPIPNSPRQCPRKYIISFEMTANLL